MNKRIAIVTGVSRLKGIGKAICIELARQGIDIFLPIGLIMTKKCLGKLPITNLI